MSDLLWNKYWTCQAKLYLLEESGTVFATSQILGDGLLLQTSNEMGGISWPPENTVLGGIWNQFQNGGKREFPLYPKMKYHSTLNDKIAGLRKQLNLQHCHGGGRQLKCFSIITDQYMLKHCKQQCDEKHYTWTGRPV